MKSHALPHPTLRPTRPIVKTQLVTVHVLRYRICQGGALILEIHRRKQMVVSAA